MVAVTKREKIAVQICSDLNNFTDLKPTLKSVIKTLKQITDIEAISIRLKDGEDYPYYLGVSWRNGYRARRIEDLITSNVTSTICSNSS